MLCEKCRIREANIKYTEVINGVKTEHNLCAQCAQELNLGQPGQYQAILEGDFPIGMLLSSILGLSDSSDRKEKTEEVVCPTCGLTYEEFVKNSCFGCPDCYHVFDLLIGDQIKKLQENSSHRGKQPRMRAGQRPVAAVSGKGEIELSKEEQIEELKRRLQAAIAEENFEEAVVCRDRLRALKGENR